MSTEDLPLINSILNGITATFLVIGLLLVKSGKKDLHKVAMATATLTSVVFLTCYLIHKYFNGTTYFTHDGWPKYTYWFVLATHVVLAIVNLPMIITMWVYALKGDYERHKKWGRYTWPIWMYVSVTGVLVYFMLYHWWPPTETLSLSFEVDSL